MSSYNRVILVGNLAQDPEIRYLNNGVAMCKLRLAVTRDFSNQQGERQTDFFTVVTWRKQAEKSAEYLSKGRSILVEGRLQNRSWDAPDGQRRSVIDIVADRVVFLGRRSQAEASPYDNGLSGYEDIPPEVIEGEDSLPETNDEVVF